MRVVLLLALVCLPACRLRLREPLTVPRAYVLLPERPAGSSVEFRTAPVPFTERLQWEYIGMVEVLPLGRGDVVIHSAIMEEVRKMGGTMYYFLTTPLSPTGQLQVNRSGQVGLGYRPYGRYVAHVMRPSRTP